MLMTSVYVIALRVLPIQTFNFDDIFGGEIEDRNVLFYLDVGQWWNITIGLTYNINMSDDNSVIFISTRMDQNWVNYVYQNIL